MATCRKRFRKAVRYGSGVCLEPQAERRRTGLAHISSPFQTPVQGRCLMRRRAQFAAALLIAAAVTPLTAPTAGAAGETLQVNVAAPYRPVTHVASGGLYGLAENNRPADAMLLPIK